MHPALAPSNDPGKRPAADTEARCCREVSIGDRKPAQGVTVESEMRAMAALTLVGWESWLCPSTACAITALGAASVDLSNTAGHDAEKPPDRSNVNTTVSPTITNS
jgi:hypothetical protein